MNPRFSISWTLVGVLAVVGGYWLVVRSMFAGGLDAEWIPYAGHIVGAAIGGGVMAAHAPLRPWREPAIAGVLAIAVLAALFMLLPHAVFGWLPLRSPHPWAKVAELAAISGGGALLGAGVVRMLSATTPSTMAIWVLSAVVITGVTVCAIHSGYGAGLTQSNRLLLVVTLGGLFLGGFITQRMVPLRRPWVCGSGALIYVLVMLAEKPTFRETSKHLVSGLFLVVIGYVGARFGWRTSREEQPSVPSARVQ